MPSRSWAGQRGAARTLLIVCCGLLELVFLRFTWIAARPEPGQWALTFFGRCPDGPDLVQGRSVSEANPPIDIDREGLVGLTPGQSFALPLASGVGYTVHGTAEELAPYLVLISDPRGPRPMPAEGHDAGATCAAGSLVPGALEGEIRWSSWRAAAPWHEDAARLRSLARACGAREVLVDARVRREGDVVVLTMGTCAGRFAVATGTTPMIGVVAGPHAVRVDRDGGWSVDRRVKPAALLIAMIVAALHGGLLIGAIGARALPLLLAEVGYSLLTTQVRAFSAGLLLFPALVVWILLGVVAGLILTWRLARPLRTTPARRRIVVLTHAMAVLALVAAPLGVSALARAAIGGPAVIDHPERPPRCLLTGYSTAGGMDIVPRGADARAALDARCGPCAHALARHAMPGHIFEDVRDLLERPDSAPMAPGGAVLFWGGGNDDIFWPMLSRRRLASALVLSAYVVEAFLRSLDSGSLLHPTALEVRAALDRAAEASATYVEEQESAIRDAAESVRARGDRFVYAHDFLAYDMGSGRSPARRLLVERRRAAVLAAGGTFVDLLEEAGPEVGVAWFDDFIHPSAWGHEQLADPLCRAVTSAGAAPSGP